MRTAEHSQTSLQRRLLKPSLPQRPHRLRLLKLPQAPPRIQHAPHQRDRHHCRAQHSLPLALTSEPRQLRQLVRPHVLQLGPRYAKQPRDALGPKGTVRALQQQQLHGHLPPSSPRQPPRSHPAPCPLLLLLFSVSFLHRHLLRLPLLSRAPLARGHRLSPSQSCLLAFLAASVSRPRPRPRPRPRARPRPRPRPAPHPRIRSRLFALRRLHARGLRVVDDQVRVSGIRASLLAGSSPPAPTLAGAVKVTPALRVSSGPSFAADA
mmetsp:Transcript_53715/g.127027  ORF Transcript_53715/g.127027 Transcript_53715/m.127027 type:complete len:265 (-) Transcript_53715:428-1222(-)